jgi:hypothetical protein
MTNIVSALNEGRVSFTYKKADGSTRQATGTTKSDLIPAGDQAASNANTDTSEQVRYYDLGSKGWRSFSRSSLDTSSIKTEAAAG